MRSKTEREKYQKRMEIFCRAYVIDLNATNAAKTAGYSEKTASSQGQRLLRNVEVQARIAELTKSQLGKLEITAGRVLLELARLAYFDPGNFFNADGSLKPINDLDEDTRRALAGLEISEEFSGSGDSRALSGYVKKIKLADKGANLERLGRYLKLFTVKVEVPGLEDLPEALREARARVNRATPEGADAIV